MFARKAEIPALARAEIEKCQMLPTECVIMHVTYHIARGRIGKIVFSVKLIYQVSKQDTPWLLGYPLGAQPKQR